MLKSVSKVLLVAVLISSAAHAQAQGVLFVKDGKVGAGLSEREIQTNYKRSTWERHLNRVRLAGNDGGTAIPPTDCPPLPTQDCLDTWDEKSN